MNETLNNIMKFINDNTYLFAPFYSKYILTLIN